jgi:hypothetical protein
MEDMMIEVRKQMATNFAVMVEWVARARKIPMQEASAFLKARLADGSISLVNKQGNPVSKTSFMSQLKKIK